MAQGTRFIRVNGRIVPIKDKDPSKRKMEKNYKKHGDGANQASRIDAKYEKRAAKGTGKFSMVAAAGILGAVGLKGKAAVASAAIGFGSAVVGHSMMRSRMKKSDVSRNREHVRTFGYDAEGRKPTKKKPRGTSAY